MSSNDDVTGREPEASDPEFDAAARLLRAAGAREAPPPELEARARARVEAHWRDLVRSSPRREPRWAGLGLALAASVALLAAAALWWMTRDESPGSGSPIASAVDSPAVSVALVHGAAFLRAAGEPDSIRPLMAGGTLAYGSTIETRDGALVAVALDDRTSLRIASDTRAVLRDPGRIDLDRGEIYIDRRPDTRTAAPPRRFEVHTAFGVISEQGTQFAVAVDDGAVRMRVREGAVAFSNGRESHRAEAGAELDWSAAEGLTVGDIAPFAEAWNWTLEAAPAVDLEGWTLDRVMEWVGRETGRKVEFVDPAVHARAGAERIAGELVLTPAEAAEIVPRLFGLSSRADRGTLFIEAARG